MMEADMSGNIKLTAHWYNVSENVIVTAIGWKSENTDDFY